MRRIIYIILAIILAIILFLWLSDWKKQPGSITKPIDQVERQTPIKKPIDQVERQTPIKKPIDQVERQTPIKKPIAKKKSVRKCVYQKRVRKIEKRDWKYHAFNPEG